MVERTLFGTLKLFKYNISFSFPCLKGSYMLWLYIISYIRRSIVVITEENVPSDDLIFDSLHGMIKKIKCCDLACMFMLDPMDSVLKWLWHVTYLHLRVLLQSSLSCQCSFTKYICTCHVT